MSTTTATPPAAAAATKGARDILLLVLHLRWKSVRRRRTAANFCPAVVPGREARKGERGSRMNDDVRVARAHLGKRYRSRSERSSLRRLPNSADFSRCFSFVHSGGRRQLTGLLRGKKYSVWKKVFVFLTDFIRHLSLSLHT